MSETLPERPSLEYLRKLAKQRLKLLRRDDPSTKLAAAQLAVARQFGFASWRQLQSHVQKTRDEARPSEDAAKPLLDAIASGNLQRVRDLLDRDPKLVNAPGDAGTPLHVAAEHNQPDLIPLLLQRGAHISARYGRSAHTPLSWAITCGAMPAAQALLDGGARADLFCTAGLGAIEQVQSFFKPSGRLQAGASMTGSSRFASDGTPLPRPPANPREIISDALYIACRNGRADVAAFLLKKNPDLQFRAYMGGTPLHWACFGASKPVINMLITAGADPSSRDDVLRCSPRAFGICTPASWGVVDLVRRQLQLDPKLVNVLDGRGTPLHEAARAGSKSVIELLLSAGADPLLRDGDGKTALDLAIENQRTEIIGQLTAATASPTDEFLKLATPDPAADHKSGSLKPAAALLKNRPSLRGDSICTACVTGSPVDIKRLLKTNPELASASGGPRNWPPLCYLSFSRFLRDDRAASARFVRCAMLLLEAGANPNSYFPAPNDPDYHEAALYGAAGIANNPAMTRLLLDAGADPNDPESLYHASEFADNAALRVLLKAKLDRKWLSYCMCHKLDMEDPAGLALFIRAGADVNVILTGGAVKGYRPLHFALLRGRSVKIIKQLLDAGTDPNLPAENGMTPYRLARRLGLTDAAELLQASGVSEELTPTQRFVAALSAGDRGAAQRMLKVDPALPQKLDADDHGLLVHAAAAGRPAAVRLMLDYGFPIEARKPFTRDWDSTALHQAAWNGHTATVRLLLKRGADPMAKHGYGGHALGAAIHGANHAGHKNGLKVVKLIAAAVDRAELEKQLEYAQTEASGAVVRVLQEMLHLGSVAATSVR